MKLCATATILKTHLLPAKYKQRQESIRAAFSPENKRISVIWGLLLCVTCAGKKETLMMMKGSDVVFACVDYT